MSDHARHDRSAHAETALTKPMHNKGSKEASSEGLRARLEPVRQPWTHNDRATTCRRHRSFELLDRPLAVVLHEADRSRIAGLTSYLTALKLQT